MVIGIPPAIQEEAEAARFLTERCTGEPARDKKEGVVAEGVAVVRVEIRREGAAALVAEEVVKGAELALVGA
jgi:hypothetical protein